MALLERIINVVAPHSCLVCDTEGKLLCNWCLPDACPSLPSRCYRCKSITDNNRTCHKCRRVSALKHVWVRTEYNGTAKGLVYRLKFSGARAAAPIIADYMQETLPYIEPALLVPIPTATRRLRQRGYDHTHLLTRELSRTTGLQSVNALGRIGQSRQVGTKRTERYKQLAGAFRLAKSDAVRGAHILLVDDVVTTGATLEEAAKTLKQAGARTVDAVIFAQKQ